MAAVGVGSVGAEGGDFGLDVVIFDFIGDDDDAEVCTDGEGAGEEIEDDVGSSAGGDVVVLGLAAEKEVADAASSEVRLMAVGAEAGDDGAGGCELGRGKHNSLS